MGRLYAGILGPMAFAIVVTRSLIHGGGLSSTVPLAVASLFVFAAVGYLAGRIAEMIVVDSVRARFLQELQAREAKRTSDPTASTQASQG